MEIKAHLLGLVVEGALVLLGLMLLLTPEMVALEGLGQRLQSPVRQLPMREEAEVEVIIPPGLVALVVAGRVVLKIQVLHLFLLQMAVQTPEAAAAGRVATVAALAQQAAQALSS